MGRVSTFQPNVGNAPASGGVSTIKSSEIPQGRAVQHTLISKGAATIANMTRLRVFAGVVPVFNVAMAFFLAWIQRFSGVTIDTSTKILPIPYWFLDELGQNARDACQVPPGLPISIEVSFGAFSASGEGLDLLTTFTDVAPKWTPMVLSSGMGILASASGRPYDPKTAGKLRGFGINTTGLLRFFFNVGKEQLYNGASGLALIGDDLLKQSVPGATGRSLNPVVVKTNPWRPLNAGGTNVYLDTDGTWAGGDNEFLTYAVQSVGEDGNLSGPLTVQPQGENV